MRNCFIAVIAIALILSLLVTPALATNGNMGAIGADGSSGEAVNQTRIKDLNVQDQNIMSPTSPVKEIAAEHTSPTVTSITPATGTNTSTVSIINLAGTNFASGATVMLTPVNVNPVHKGSITVGLDPTCVYVSGNYAYVTSHWFESLEIVDVSNPAVPVHKGNIKNGAGGALLPQPRAVYVSGNYAYVVGYNPDGKLANDINNSALEIVDISNPTNPVHKGVITNGTGGALLLYPMSIYVSGNYAYVASRGSNALEIVDISNPSAPVHKGSIVTGTDGALLDGPFGVYVSGNYAYVTSWGSNALEIVDISNPSIPVHKGSIINGTDGALLDLPYNVFISGNYAYIASSYSNALEIVDISNPAAPHHEGNIVDGDGGALLQFPYNVFISGNYAYLASSHSHALEIVDISNPSAPVHKGSILDGSGGANIGNPTYVYLSGNYAYMVGNVAGSGFGNGALEIIDIGTVTATNVNVVSANQITGTFNLTGKIAGLYNVVVTNPNGRFGILPNGFIVTSAPIANFEGTPNAGTVPLTVTFTDSSTHTPTGWSWSFGDGSSVNATMQNPVHTYANNGTYTVSLTATNTAGSNTTTVANYITVNTPGTETYIFVTKWGSAGSGNGQFYDVSNIAADSGGNVYVADTQNHRIQKFSSDGTFITKWGSYGTGNGQFNYPLAVAVDSIGNVYVADAWNQRIQKFLSDGTFITSWKFPDDQQLSYYISGIAVDSNGNVYVLDGNNAGIQKYSSNGTFIINWKSLDYNLWYWMAPRGVAIDPNGNVYVSDCNGNLLKFTSNGTLIKSWGWGEFNGPWGVAIDSNGNEYISDLRNHRIQKFTENGTFITKWGYQGSRNGQFYGPEGIAVDSLGNVYVADTGNNRIQKFSFNGVPTPSLSISHLNPTYATNSGKTTLEIIGTGFQSGTTVFLKRSGEPDIVATDVTVVPQTKIICSIDLTGAKEGSWDVYVKNPGGNQTVLSGGFIVKSVPQIPPTYAPSPVSITINENSGDGWIDTLGDEQDQKETISFMITPADFSGTLAVEIKNKSGYVYKPVELSSVAVHGGSNTIVWDGKIGGVKVNEAHNPYSVNLVLKQNGQTVSTSKLYRIWVGRPLLFVHGIFDSRENMENTKLYTKLKKDYYVTAIEYVPGIPNAFGNIVDYAQTLHYKIDSIKYTTNSKKVDIISHSMGGLISRYQTEIVPSGRDDIGKLIMIGTPNHGSEFASIPDLALKAIISKLIPIDTPNVIVQIIVDKIKGKVIDKVKDPFLGYLQENYAIYEMMPHSVFLNRLNGNDACEYYIKNGNVIDDIKNTDGYYTVAANYYEYPTWTHAHFIAGFVNEKYPVATWEGDFIVPYYSSKISGVTQYPAYNVPHWKQFDSDNIISTVKLILNQKDTGSIQISSESPLGLRHISDAENTQIRNLSPFWNPPITFHLVPSNSQNITIKVENATTKCDFILLWDTGEMNVTFIDPNGTSTDFSFVNTSLEYTSTSPLSGSWTITVNPISIPHDGTNVSIQTIQLNPLYLSGVTNETSFKPQQSIDIISYIGSNDYPAIGSIVIVNITRPDNSFEQLSLFDDGSHNDILLNDGFYRNVFTNTNIPGIYCLEINASGFFQNHTFQRQNSIFVELNYYPYLTFSPNAINLSSLTPIPGESIKISAIVHNIGDTGAANTTILFTDTIDNSTREIGNVTINIDKNNQQEINTTWKVKPGNHTLSVFISPFNTFYETDYANNNASISIAIPSPQMNIRTANLTMNPGEAGNLSIYISNMTDIGSYSVSYLFNSSVIEVCKISSESTFIVNQSFNSGQVEFNGTVGIGVSGNVSLATISLNATDELPEDGTYTTLIVELFDSDGILAVQQIIPGSITINHEIDLQLSANFDANITSGKVPLTVQFNDTSTGSPTSWNWSFGDSAFSSLQSPVHTYMLADNYTVTLTASNAGGSNTTVRDRYIVIYPKGDFNHNWKVDIGDVARVAYMVVGLTPIDPAADFNGNGDVDIGDAAKIGWFSVGRIMEL